MILTGKYFFLQCILVLEFSILWKVTAQEDNEVNPEEEKYTLIDETCYNPEDVYSNNITEVKILDEGNQWEWQLECLDEKDCPDPWKCFKNFCYPPAPLPSYIKSIRPPNTAEVVRYKVGLINCNLKNCQCPEGFDCLPATGKCKERTEFASGGEIATTVAQVGGVSRFRVQNTIFNDVAMSSMRCKLCPPRTVHDTQPCYPLRCNHRNRCWCDYYCARRRGRGRCGRG